MGEYQLIVTRYLGSSRVDNIPSAVGKKGYLRYDADTKREFYSDGTNWLVLRKQRTGVYHAKSRVGVDAEGSLKGLVGLGNQGTTNLNTAGKYHIWNTRGTLANGVAGVLKLDQWIEWRNRSPIFIFKFLWVANTGNNRRMFKGVGPQRIINVDNDLTPLNSNEFGFFFGHGASDTQWQIWHNDATGTCVKESTGVNIPSINTNLLLEIQAENSLGFVWALYNITGDERGSVITSGVTNSRIPASTTSTYIADLVAASDTSVQSNNIHRIEVYSD